MGIQTSSINNGPTSGFKNAIINGNFDFWQRGTSTTINQSYAADRWQLQRVGSTCTNSQQTFTVGQTDVPNNPTYWMRNVVTSSAGAGNYVANLQFIEDVRIFAGQQITISYWAKADAAKPIAIEIRQFFGTGGSPSSPVTAFVAKPTLSTSWARYSHTVTVPSISGKTIGNDTNSSYLNITFFFDAGSDYNSRTNSLGNQSGTFDISQVQVEAGPVATTFERRPIGTELALCQRYYETSAGSQGSYVFYSGDVTSGLSYYTTNRFIVTKRAAPNVTTVNGGASGFPTTASSVSNVDAAGFRADRVCNSTTNGGFFFDFWSATSDF